MGWGFGTRGGFGFGNGWRWTGAGYQSGAHGGMGYGALSDKDNPHGFTSVFAMLAMAMEMAGVGSGNFGAIPTTWPQR